MRRFPAICVLAILMGAWPCIAAEPWPRASTAPAAGTGDVERPSIAGRRIVKHFDFNEAPLGNHESLPMKWRRHGGTGFPLFLEGRFERSLGHEEPPCFRLDLDGGSVAYHYQGDDISVRTNSDYLVVAWVRTQGLESARAYLTGCFLDRKGAVITGTERRSNLLGGTRDQGDWQAVTLGLPGGIPNTRYIGVSVWLAQADLWNRAAPTPHAIQKEDISGSAWFDDITVYRLPRVALAASRASNVFRHDEPVELRTEVTDPDGLNLAAVLDVYDADGNKLDERPVEIHSDRGSGYARNVYPELGVGFYRAELRVTTGPTVLVRREMRFARLPAPISPDPARGRRFGIILDRVEPVVFEAQRDLLTHLHPEYVKLPVWSLHAAADPAALDRYLQAVVDAGAEPVGVLVDDSPAAPELPAATTQPQQPRGLVDLFAQEPAGWKSLIASTWSRYAGLVSVWQVGQDGRDHIVNDPRIGAMLNALRREMLPLMNQPMLATSGSAHEPGPSPQPGDFHCVRLPHAIPVEDIAAHLEPAVAASGGRCWTVVEPLPDTMSRRLRLFDLARRLAEALFTARQGVFMVAPWDAVYSDPLRPRIDPREDLIIFRTVSDVLGEAVPVSRTMIDGQAHCLVFDRNARGTLLVWDPEAPPQGREHFLPLGPESQLLDLWGRRRAIETVGQQQRLVVGPEPMFVLNVSTWMIEFLRQFRMEPPSIEFSYDVYEREIAFRNTYRETIAGTLRLVGPPDWDIRPSRIPFSLAAGQTFRQAVSIRFPVNAQAGVLPLVGEFTVDADRPYRFQAATWFELALRDIDLQTYTYRMGDRLVVRQTMTNHTQLPVHFQGYLLAPGRARIERTFANFEPGQSITKDFILENAAQLSGRSIRIGLKEIQGTRVWNRVLTVP